MDFYLARDDSLRLLRWARSQKDFCLLEHPVSREAELKMERPSRSDLLRLRGELPQDVIGPRGADRICLHFGARAGKSQSSLARVTPSSAAPDPSAFLEVALTDGSSPWGTAAVRDRAFVEGAALSLVSCGLDLERRISRGELTREAALVRASAFAMELAGTYCRNPVNPAGGKVTYGVVPVGKVSAMADWLTESRHLAGIDLARMACARAANGSASAMETFWYHAFCMPPRLGGMHFPRPRLNEGIAWPEAVRKAVCHKTMRPDFLWPEHALACEYDGSTHREDEAFRQDRERLRDYALCDVSLLVLTAEDSRDLASLRRTLSQVAALLARSEPECFSRRVRRNLASKEADAARRVLMSQLLPGQSVGSA